MENIRVDEIIKNAIKEDITNVDLSTEAIFKDKNASVDLISKDEGVIAGLDEFKRVFEIMAQYNKSKVNFKEYFNNGDEIKNKDLIMTIFSSAKVLLSSERVSLNILQRMSGIATKTKKMVDALSDNNIKIVDTRKTTPGLRILEKKAVRLGRGFNHRFNLSDAIMLKDNHIKAAEGVKEAIKMAKEYAPFTTKIEVEVEDLSMLKDALKAGADIIMLDNMDIETTQKAIELISKKAVIEVSGNISEDNISRYRGMDIDVISSGALTHSAGIIDLSMKNLRINK